MMLKIEIFAQVLAFHNDNFDDFQEQKSTYFGIFQSYLGVVKKLHSHSFRPSRTPHFGVFSAQKVGK